MCSVGRVNVFSFGGNVSSFRANVSSFWPNVFSFEGDVSTLAGDVSSFWVGRVPSVLTSARRNDTGQVAGAGWLVTRVGVGLGGIGGRIEAGDGGGWQ